MFDEFEKLMKEGYNMKKLIADIDKDRELTWRRQSEKDDSFINQVDQFLYDQKVGDEKQK